MNPETSSKSASSKTPSRITPLFDAHIEAGAKIIDFHGWQLPIHYGSQIEEHKAVRSGAGVFDVSHMAAIDINGEAAESFLRHLLCNDVAKLADGRALYSCLCNDDGGVIDDLIVYRRQADSYRLVVNAATAKKDLDWITQHAASGVDIVALDNTAMLAVQGPDAVEKAIPVLKKFGVTINSVSLKTFSSIESNDWFVGRTGYTGEDGIEVLCSANSASDFFRSLVEKGVTPCGLGARDTLRLEAGLCLYGQDLDEQHTPIESGLSWVVDLKDNDRDFIGKAKLLEQKAIGEHEHQIALQLDQRGVMRAGQAVQLAGNTIGELTSGSFSPMLQTSIALARVNQPVNHTCDVIIRDKPLPARVVKLPFV